MRLLHRVQSGNRQPAEPFDTLLCTPRLLGRLDDGLVCVRNLPKVPNLREGDSGDGARTDKTVSGDYYLYYGNPWPYWRGYFNGPRSDPWPLG